MSIDSSPSSPCSRVEATERGFGPARPRRRSQFDAAVRLDVLASGGSPLFALASRRSGAISALGAGAVPARPTVAVRIPIGLMFSTQTWPRCGGVRRPPRRRGGPRVGSWRRGAPCRAGLRWGRGRCTVHPSVAWRPNRGAGRRRRQCSVRTGVRPLRTRLVAAGGCFAARVGTRTWATRAVNSVCQAERGEISAAVGDDGPWP